MTAPSRYASRFVPVFGVGLPLLASARTCGGGMQAPALYAAEGPEMDTWMVGLLLAGVLALLLAGMFIRKRRNKRRLRAERRQARDQREHLHAKMRELAELAAAGAPEFAPLRSADLSTLDKAEREVLAWIGRGYADREIAERMFLNIAEVRDAMRRVCRKLGVDDRVQAGAIALLAGLSPPASPEM